jgi:hypothetical protein
MQREKHMLEREWVFGNGACATLTLPRPDGTSPAALLLHGFASHRDEVGGLYRRLAAALAARGVAVSEIAVYPGEIKFAFLSDPDGNSWALQEIPPGL